MAVDAQALYVQLGRLSENVPDLAKFGPRPTEAQMWLGRLHALVIEIGDGSLIAKLKDAINILDSRLYGSGSLVLHMMQNAQSDILSVLYMSLARAEISAPSVSQGAFIPAGNSFDAMSAIGKALAPATHDVLMVDPYMDEKALTDFALLVTAGVKIRLLADKRHHKPTLAPAVQRWSSQYTATRPLEARLAPERTLHDRLIIVDDTTVWVLTQSLNAFAARAPASIVRSDGDAAGLKVDAYRDMWASASAL